MVKGFLDKLCKTSMALSAQLCRLCGKEDPNGIRIYGEDSWKKIIPTRVQEVISLTIRSNISLPCRICQNCLSMIDQIELFLRKIHEAQATFSNEMKTNEIIPMSPKQVQPKARRREAKLVPFLVRSLDTGQFRGLVWEDRSKGLFRLPWPRQGTNKWRPEDSQLFKEWAVLKGRYNTLKEDFVLWKTCIRTSLHKLPNIQEVKGLHNLGADPPYKVYLITDFADNLLKYMNSVQIDHDYTCSYAYSNLYDSSEVENETYEIVDVKTGVTYTINSESEFDKLCNTISLPELEGQTTSSPTKMKQGFTLEDDLTWLVAQEETIGEDPKISDSKNSDIDDDSKTLNNDKRDGLKYFQKRPQRNLRFWRQKKKTYSKGSPGKHDYSEGNLEIDEKMSIKTEANTAEDSDNSLELFMSDEDDNVKDQYDDGDDDLSLDEEAAMQDTSYGCKTCDLQFADAEEFDKHLDLHVSGKLHHLLKAVQSEVEGMKKLKPHSSTQGNPPATQRRSGRTKMIHVKAQDKVTKSRKGTRVRSGRNPLGSSYTNNRISKKKPGRKFSNVDSSSRRSSSNDVKSRECYQCRKQFTNMCELVKHRQQCQKPYMELRGKSDYQEQRKKLPLKRGPKRKTCK